MKLRTKPDCIDPGHELKLQESNTIDRLLTQNV